MKCIPIDLKKFQETYALANPKTFLQGVGYNQFRSLCGETFETFNIEYNGQIVGGVQIQHFKTKLKTYVHIPHGPIFISNFVPTEPFWNHFLTWYKAYAQAKKVDLARISPLVKTELKTVFAKAGFKNAAIHLVNPEKTWVLDITHSEEDLLAGMKKSTRYEVNKAKKLNLPVKIGNTPEDLNIFWNLHSQTVSRQGFVPFPKKNTQHQLKAYQDNCQIVSVADPEGNWLSSSIFIFDNVAGYYHQGASVYSKLPASHYSLWQGILLAKARGCKAFNFWGVCDENAKAHPWFGLSKFKRGFGGDEENYLHVQDYERTFKAKINRWLEIYRRKKRGY